MVLVGPVTVSAPENGHNETVDCLFDSGASHTFIRKDLADKLGLKTVHEINRPAEVFGEKKGMLKIPIVHAKIKVDTCDWDWLFGVAETTPKPVVLGNDMMGYLDIVLRETPGPGEKQVEARACAIRM